RNARPALRAFAPVLQWADLYGSRRRHAHIAECKDRRAILLTGTLGSARLVLRVAGRGGWPDLCELAGGQADRGQSRRRKTGSPSPGGFRRPNFCDAGRGGTEYLRADANEFVRVWEVGMFNHG